MPSPTNLDPTTLTPGQRVRLKWQGEAKPRRHHALFLSWQGNHLTFGDSRDPKILLRLELRADGTLRDSEGRIVEVRECRNSVSSH